MAAAFVSTTYPANPVLIARSTSTVASVPIRQRPVADPVRLPIDELPKNIDESKTSEELKSQTSGSALGQFLSDQQTKGARQSAMSAMVIPLLQHFHKVELPNMRIRRGNQYLGGCSLGGPIRWVPTKVFLKMSDSQILWKLDVATGTCYSTANAAFGERTMELVCCPTGSRLVVDVRDGGSGFAVPPAFTVSAPPNGGVQASFQATINGDGAITGVTVERAAGYVVPPSSVTYKVGSSETDALSSMLQVRVLPDTEHVTLFWKKDNKFYCLGTDFIVDVCEDWTLPIMDSPAMHHFAGPTLVESLDVEIVERPVVPTKESRVNGVVVLQHNDFVRSDVVGVTALGTGTSRTVQSVRAREGDFTVDALGVYGHKSSSETLGSVASALLIRK